MVPMTSDLTPQRRASDWPVVGRSSEPSAAPSENLPAGRKFDGGKPRWSLLPKGVVKCVVKVLEFGAVKYGFENWKSVPNARQRYYDALIRHVESWWDGETYDPETSQHHLAHAVCCAFFLIWMDTNGNLPETSPESSGSTKPPDEA